MPVPWKKAKIGRISRFVSDFRSSRRGGSLVVETGFPTSVIDLIVKNRDRLKKPSKKKPLEVWDPIPLFSSSSNSSNSRFSPSPVVSPLEIESPKQPTGEETHPLVANLVENVSKVPASNGTFMIIIKVFFMLILALGTKKLAFGITVSAFALLFLESAAIRVFCFLKPCADARKSLKSVVERVWFFFHPKTKLIGLDGSAVTEETMGNDIFGLSEVGQASIEEIKPVVPDLDVLSCEKRWGIDVSEDGQARSKDIQLVEPGLDFLSRERRWGTGSSEVDQASCEGIQRVESSLNLLSPERRWGIRSIEGGQARSQEIQLVEPKLDLLSRERWEFGQSDQKLKILEKVEDFVQVTNPRSQRTNSTKLKAKFLKRLIPKKFRSSKGVMHKEHQPASSIETSNCSGEEKLSGGEELERKEDELEEPEDEEVEKNTDEEEEEVQNFVDVLHVDLDAAVVQDNYRRTQGSSGYVLLIVIVLAGLVGGRFIALELTIAWCLLVKSMGVVKRILKMS